MTMEAAIDKKAAAKRSELRDNTIEKPTRSHEASLLNTREHNSGIPATNSPELDGQC
jgi:hypothetical protein